MAPFAGTRAFSAWGLHQFVDQRQRFRVFHADDRFYALEESNGAWAGYVRVGRKGDVWRITDFALSDQSERRAEQLYAALLDLAQREGASRVGGWLPESAAARKFFDITPRQTEITMIKPLVALANFDRETIAGTSRFCEIDHV